MKTLRQQLEEIKNILYPNKPAKAAVVATRNKSLLHANEYITCPKCSKSVKKKNLKRHTQRIHNKKKNVTRKCRKKTVTFKPKPLRCSGISTEVAAGMLKVMKETNLIQNMEIKDYLKRNPSEDGSGKYGTPQDKYRWGFYGSKSMDYDIWRKGDKNK